MFLDGRQDPYEPSLVLDQIRVETSGDYASTFSTHHIRCAYLPTTSPVAARLSSSGWSALVPRRVVGRPRAMISTKTHAPLHALAFVAAVVRLYSMRQADPDLFGYLASGRLFVEQGGVTTHDPFAYTTAGFQWVTFEYGAHVLLWLAYRFAGPVGLIALKCLLGGVALAFLAAAVRAASRQPHVWVPVFVLCASAVSRFFLFRPQLFTFAFLRCLSPSCSGTRRPAGAAVGAAARHGRMGQHARRLRRRPRGHRARDRDTRVTAPARETALGRAWRLRRRHLREPHGRAALGLCPHGAHARHERRYTVEWGPASLNTDAWSAIALTFIAVTLLGLTWFACRDAPRAERTSRLVWALTCVPLVVMAYVSVRHVPLAAIWAAPVIARLASDALESAAFRRVWFAFQGVAVVPACLTAVLAFVSPQPVISADGGALGSRHPCSAAAFLKANHLSGNVFTPLWWGSYLTWELYPSVRVSMDGRNISLYTDRMVVENFDFYLKNASEADVDVPLRYATRLRPRPGRQPRAVASRDGLALAPGVQGRGCRALRPFGRRPSRRAGPSSVVLRPRAGIARQ